MDEEKQKLDALAARVESLQTASHSSASQALSVALSGTRKDPAGGLNLDSAARLDADLARFDTQGALNMSTANIIQGRSKILLVRRDVLSKTTKDIVAALPTAIMTAATNEAALAKAQQKAQDAQDRAAAEQRRMDRNPNSK